MFNFFNLLKNDQILTEILQWSNCSFRVWKLERPDRTCHQPGQNHLSSPSHCSPPVQENGGSPNLRSAEWQEVEHVGKGKGGMNANGLFYDDTCGVSTCWTCTEMFPKGFHWKLLKKVSQKISLIDMDLPTLWAHLGSPGQEPSNAPQKQQGMRMQCRKYKLYDSTQ